MIIQPNGAGGFCAYQVVHNRPVMADMPSRGEAKEECLVLIQATHAAYEIGKMNARKEFLTFYKFLNKYPVGSAEELGYNEEKKAICKKEGIACNA